MECTVCIRYLKRHYVGELPATIANKLKNDEEHSKYMGGLKIFEDGVNSGDPAAVARKKRGDPGPAKKVEAVQSQMLKFSRNLGVWWPEAVWNAHYPDQLCLPEELQVLSQNQSLGKGVVRDPKFGTPIGTVNLTSESSTGSLLTSCVNDSRENTRDDETEQAWKAASKRMAIAPKVVEKKDGLSVHTLDMDRKVKKAKTEDDLLDELMDFSGCFLDSGPKVGNGVGTGSGSGLGPSRGGAGNGTFGAGIAGIAKKKAGKLAQEIMKSEAALLQVTHFFRSLGSSDYTSLTAKGFVALSEKVKARMTDSLVELYSQDYNPLDGSGSGASSGMAVLEKLNVVVRQLRVVGPLVHMLLDNKQEQADGATLEEMIAQVQREDATIVLPPCLHELSLTRELNINFAKERWEAFMAVLATNSDTSLTATDRPTTVMLLTESRRGEFQTAAFIKGVVDLLRQDGNLGKLKDFLAAMSKRELQLCNDDLMNEVESLRKLLDPMSDKVGFATCAGLRSRGV